MIATLAEPGARRGHRRDGRHRRPRRVPARRTTGACGSWRPARGITETKLYDRQGVIDRYGIPPELIPDFYGLKGDTSDNIPGVPGIGDKTASDLLQRVRRPREVLASIDEISGAKRKENLTDHADDARMSKQLATDPARRAGRHRPSEEVAREPDRSELRETFRAFELRDPLRRLEEALGEDEAAAPARRDRATLERARARGARGRPGSADGETPRSRIAAAAAASRPRASCSPSASRWRFAAYAGGDGAGRRGRDAAAETMGWGERPLVAHDSKSIAAPCPAEPRARHAGRRLPARSGAARLPARRAARGRGHRRRRQGRDGWPRDAVGTRALAARQREHAARSAG